MYLITGGQVDIDIDGKHILLGVGHFFGEIAVLQRGTPLGHRSGWWSIPAKMGWRGSLTSGDGRRAQGIDERARRLH
jgi:hypothetical protein